MLSSKALQIFLNDDCPSIQSSTKGDFSMSNTCMDYIFPAGNVIIFQDWYYSWIYIFEMYESYQVAFNGITNELYQSHNQTKGVAVKYSIDGKNIELCIKIKFTWKWFDLWFISF